MTSKNHQKTIHYSICDGGIIDDLRNVTGSISDFTRYFLSDDAQGCGQRANDHPNGNKAPIIEKSKTRFFSPSHIGSRGQYLPCPWCADALIYQFPSVPNDVSSPILEGVKLKGVPHIVHTWAAPTPHRDSLRIIIFLNAPIDARSYETFSRIACEDLLDPGLDFVDPKSFSPPLFVRLPVPELDEQYRVHIDLGGQAVEWDRILDSYGIHVADALDFEGAQCKFSTGNPT